jgi:CRP-like cAMP-binding protein
VTWGEHTEDFFTETTSLQSSPSSIADPKRSKRISNKKRNVALHAEYRVNHEMGILAPPLCCETIMEATDNVFAGQDLGVDTLQNGYGALGSTITVASSSSNDKSDMGSSLPLHSQGSVDTLFDHKHHEEHHFIKHEKTPEENEFLDEALADEDNIVFEMVPEHLRQMLKDYLERITVPKNTLLIKKGDEADYLYLILEGEVGVYIDPEEYMDENAMDIGKHAPLDISLSRRQSSSSSLAGSGTTKREFKQSYVLNLRKSLFGSTYNENSSSGSNSSNTGLLGRFFNVGQNGFNDSRMSDVSKNTTLGVLLEDASTSANEDEEASFNLYKDLKGLKHERDLGPQDVFGELALIYNCPRTASCVTSTTCVLYRIDGDAFRRILSSSNTDRNQKRYTESKAATEALYNLGVVEELDEQTLKDFGNSLSPVVFKKGDTVITKGQYNDLMIFVMSGKLLVHDAKVGDSTKENLVLNEGGHFGEAELLFGFPSYANVTVLSPKARLMAISKKDYRRR